jgi:hypothetical protein
MSLSSRVLLMALALSLLGCGPNPGVLKSGQPEPTNAASGPARSAFEQDLHDIRETEYSYIFVLRRKDGGGLDQEDRAFIRTHMPNANRRVLTDQDRAVLIGSNAEIPVENLKAIYGRFAVEDYSPPKTNANTQP